MARPKLNKNITLQSFKEYYWLKKELIDFCKKVEINTSGGKIELLNRISDFLKIGKIKNEVKKKKTTSNFNWKTEELNLKTIITDNYKNTENVRMFFINKIGNHFKFNIQFMEWMKNNKGKTLEDAIIQWHLIKKDKSIINIAPQFEYNIFIRDFFISNPDLTLKDAIKKWKIVREKSGSKKYVQID